MSMIICHHNGKFNAYTTVTDGFCFKSYITEEQLRSYYEEAYGLNSMFDFEQRLIRAKEKGVSSHIHSSLKDFLYYNRAGENEEHLSYEECLKLFFGEE